MDIKLKTEKGTFKYRVGAIIIHDGKLLAVHDDVSPYYYLPYRRQSEIARNRRSRYFAGNQRGAERGRGNCAPAVDLPKPFQRGRDERAISRIVLLLFDRRKQHRFAFARQQVCNERGRKDKHLRMAEYFPTKKLIFSS